MKGFLTSTLLVFIVLVTYLSLRQTNGGIEVPVNDKIGHSIAYTVLMVNAGLLIHRKYHFIPAILFLVYGAIIEFLQGLIPGRVSSIEDLIANSFGLALGLAFLFIFGDRFILALKKTGIFSLKNEHGKT